MTRKRKMKKLICNPDSCWLDSAQTGQEATSNSMAGSKATMRGRKGLPHYAQRKAKIN